MEKTGSNTTSDSPACPADLNKLNRTIAFILDVQTCFEPDRKETYQCFLDSFTEYQTAITSTDTISDRAERISAMREKVTDLLKDDADLLAEFESFFPREVEGTI
ncbi:hypothetical protein OIDMADRAFT_16587 [Oidiodendron maius Zn]|uniref:Uncharacterized protein n=1 Tax=Oidiodendron maius (strain Zn) TaxID=913774 RepID=A0A0C3I1L0_OIDMZ|nr:hypothetical protein OIDMADRAFT_16587 [Oidiodendron maius Zn]